MQHAHLVHVLEPCGKLNEPAHQLVLRQLVLPFRLGFLPPPGEHRAQIAASRQLHQYADRPRLKKRSMIADNVGMLQSCQSIRLHLHLLGVWLPSRAEARPFQRILLTRREVLD